jgi:hypothetical protein
MLLSYELLQKLFNDPENVLVDPMELGNSLVVENRWTVMNRWGKSFKVSICLLSFFLLPFLPSQSSFDFDDRHSSCLHHVT